MKNKYIVLVLMISCFEGTLFSHGHPSEDCFPEKSERVYVHLQKQVLIPGEPLEYKAYVVTLPGLKPSGLSKIVYFAIRDTSNRLAMDWRANLVRGTCSGSVMLPDTLSSGIYTLYAFTNWMRNIPPAYFYNSRILISNVTDPDPERLIVPLPWPTRKPIISFFPEGGNFVEGLMNNIGFRINDPDEIPKISSGVLKDNTGNLLDSLEFSANGTGRFPLRPESGKHYIAELVTLDRGRIDIPLPAPTKSGTTMLVENSPDDYVIHIHSDSSTYFRNKQLNVTARSKGKEVFKSPVVIQDGSGRAQIAKASLPEGIIDIRISDTSGNAAAERLVYLEKRDGPEIKIGNLKSEYTKKEKIRVEIEAGKFEGHDTLNFSVSVTSADPFQSDLYNTGIDLYLTLCSGIQGIPFTERIHFPGIPPDDLLLASDVDQYAWDLKGRQHECGYKYFTENRGFVLSGTIYSGDPLSPVSNSVVLLSCKDSIAWLDYSYTDRSGNFRFLIDKQYDNRDLILQLGDQIRPGQKTIWKLDDKYDNLPPTGHFPLDLTNEDKQYLDLNREIFLIEKVFNRMKEPEVAALLQRKLNFYGDRDYSVDPADYVPLDDFTDISANILPGVRFRNNKDSLSLNLWNADRNEFFTNSATVLLNGVPLNDLSWLSPLGSKVIRKIDVVQSKVIYGDLSFYGILSVQTSDGVIPAAYLKKNAFVYKNAVSENSRKHDAARTENAARDPNVPDLGRTLYWNPDMTICGNKKITLEFSASDLQSKYEINIQGISSKGIPVSASAYFTVK